MGRDTLPGTTSRRSTRRTAFIALALAIGAAVVPAPARAATPVLTTQVAPEFVDLNQSFFDTVFLSGGNNPTGTLTFTGFTNKPTCALPASVTQTRQVDHGNGIYEAPNFVSLSVAGSLRWRVSYSGDANNDPVTTACSAPNELVTSRTSGVAMNDVVSNASLNTTVGSPITDSVTVGRAVSPKPTGDVFFRLFGPDNALCSGDPVFGSVKTLAGDGTATSDPFTPTAPGRYRWTVDYLGNSTFDGSLGACNQPGADVQVAPVDVTPPPGSAAPSTRPAPDTFITSPPLNKTRDRTPTFTIASDQVAAFQCSVDESAFTPCSPSQTLSRLSRGSHTFAARAVNADGVIDQTPAEETFKVVRRHRRRR